MFIFRWWASLSDALGVRKYIILITAGSAAGLIAYLYSILSGWEPMSWLPQIPGWVFFLFVLLVSLVVLLLSYATELRLRLAPKIKVARNDTTLTVFTPINVNVLYIQLVVEAVDGNASSCIGYLTGVLKNDAPTNYVQSMRLEWGHRKHEPIEIRARAPQRLNIARIQENDKTLTPCVEAVPNNCMDVFSDASAEYRFDVVITSEAGRSVSKALLVKPKAERWDDPSIRMIDVAE